MFTIIQKRVLTATTKSFQVAAPYVARKAKPGNFVLVRGDKFGERIPLTIADSDTVKGTITIVFQEIGKGTVKLGMLSEGDSILDVVGPLGKAVDIDGGGRTICCIAGGLGVAPLYPQAKAHHNAGNRVISITGARSADLIFWKDEMEAVSEYALYSTDDGSLGHHGHATQLLEQLVNDGELIDEVIAIGPIPHMKAVVDLCKRLDLPVTVSLNPIMVDGTGMCGGCRVVVNGEVKYACVDGPEFDGAAVDFEELMARQGTFQKNEAVAAEPETHACRLGQRVGNGPGAALGFGEASVGLTEEEAFGEADRCLLCKRPRCITGCPVEVEIPAFIKALQERNIAEAAHILKRKNSLPAVCGRVCPQETQCERVCTLSVKGSAVHIGRLERFVADWESANRCAVPQKPEPQGKNVAVVGSGPGGLTCAAELAKLGYDVTLFEALHDTGGVLRYGIPEFRLPKAIVDQEVDYIKRLGVDIQLNMVVGKTLSVEELLKTEYAAAFVAVGAGAPAFLDIPGEGLVGVTSANEFLTRVNLMKAYRDGYDTPVQLGRNVVVVGAGNVAMDAARTALRLGAQDVTILYRRSRNEMPARAEEILHAEQEGVQFLLLTNPFSLIGDDEGHIVGVECIRMSLGEADDSGRCRPVPIEGSEFCVRCDMLIPALGNRPNPILTQATDGLELSKAGTIVVDKRTGATSIPGLYAGGDIVSGAATVIEAMGAGKRAAAAMHAYLHQANA